MPHAHSNLPLFSGNDPCAKIKILPSANAPLGSLKSGLVKSVFQPNHRFMLYHIPAEHSGRWFIR